MSYPDFINKLKLYTKSIAQKEPEQIETDYLGEDIESYLNGKLNPPKEAVAALEHVYAFSRSQSMESRSHTDYYELYFKQKDSEFGLYEENVLPEYNKLQRDKDLRKTQSNSLKAKRWKAGWTLTHPRKTQ